MSTNRRFFPSMVTASYRFTPETTLEQLLEECSCVVGVARDCVKARMDNEDVAEADFAPLYLLRHLESLIGAIDDRCRAERRMGSSEARPAPHPPLELGAEAQKESPDALAHGATAAQQMLREARASFLESGFEAGSEFEGVAAHEIFPALSGAMVELMSSENYRYGFSLGLAYHMRTWLQKAGTRDALKRDVIDALVGNQVIHPPAVSGAMGSTTTAKAAEEMPA